ncbi:MAG: peptidoglycan endopeptidase [Betaproteobacteria bacterium]|nr:peptidoglycan endopeptidase [Betaproteobacteria bacterium]
MPPACSRVRFVNRRHALFRLAIIPGTLSLPALARAQSIEVPGLPDPPPSSTPRVSLTPSSSLESFTAAPAATTLRAGVDDLLFKALSLVGVRYRPGGVSPETGFDCSGYVCYLYREVFAMSLPRTADGIGRHGSEVPRTALQPGDLVFFNTMHRPFTHVGLYIGDERFVHSPSSGGLVRTESLNERYWVKRWNGARRISPA